MASLGIGGSICELLKLFQIKQLFQNVKVKYFQGSSKVSSLLIKWLKFKFQLPLFLRQVGSAPKRFVILYFSLFSQIKFSFHIQCSVVNYVCIFHVHSRMQHKKLSKFTHQKGSQDCCRHVRNRP